MIPFSILDLAHIRQGAGPADAFARMRRQARLAESLGYHRYWLAEHHNLPGIACSATSVLIGHVAQATRHIRVGSGGVMLPNHAPLVIAEQFGTLETLYPGRIDLGLGRAPGTDPRTSHALRRDLTHTSENFPQDVMELLAHFAGETAPGGVQAMPGTGLGVPIWLLGSSLFSAQLAAHLGLPYAFASHFAPAMLFQALATYRAGFQPSQALAEPCAMVAVNVVAADSDAEAVRLFTSQQQMVNNLVSGRPGPMPPPVDSMEGIWSPHHRAVVEEMTACSVVGGPERVRQGMQALIAETGADEIIATVRIFDEDACHRSISLLAEIMELPARENAGVDGQ